MVGVGQMSDIQSEIPRFSPAKIEKQQDLGILSNILRRHRHEDVKVTF
jgi:hypothetical protein